MAFLRLTRGSPVGRTKMGSGEYRRYAAECLRIAAKVKDPKIKATLLAMVNAWLYLAELAEKNAKRAEREQRLNS